MEVSVLFATVGNGILLQPRVYSIVQRLLWDCRLGTSVLTNLSSCQLPWLIQESPAKCRLCTPSFSSKVRNRHHHRSGSKATCLDFLCAVCGCRPPEFFNDDDDDDDDDKDDEDDDDHDNDHDDDHDNDHDDDNDDDAK